MRKLYLFLVALVFFAACGGDEKMVLTQGESADTAWWKVAVLPTMECLPLVVADHGGFFAAEGLSVGLRRFEAQMDIDTALAGGSVAAGVSDLVRLEHLRQQRVELTSVTATDACWQLLAMRPARITKAVQLDDKMLAMTRYSATDLLSDLIVDSARLKSERVFRIQVNNIAVRLGMLESGIMDAMFLPEPQATVGRNQQATLLYDTRKDSLWLGCILFRNDSLKGHDRQLKAMQKAYDRAVDSLNILGLHAYDALIEKFYGLTSAAIDSLPSDMKFSRWHQPSARDTLRVKQWWEKRVASMKYVEKRYLQ